MPEKLQDMGVQRVCFVYDTKLSKSTCSHYVGGNENKLQDTYREGNTL